MLARGGLRCIGATTLTEYRKHISNDPALERRFQQVLCGQPSVEDTISILRGLRERYELHHGVKISYGSLVSAAVLADRYITERFLPDKAIDLIDEAAAKLKMEIASKPTELDELDRAITELEMEKLSLKNDTDKVSKERQQYLDNKLTTLKEKQKEFSDQLKEAKSIRSFKEEYGTLMSLQRQLEETEKKNLANPRELEQSLLLEEVTGLDIAKIVSKWTGIPVSNLEQSEREKLVMLEQELHKRVVGQDSAVESVADAVRCSRAGLSDPNRPLASFMFMGPTGVGKTELAKALAGYLFNTEDAMVRRPYSVVLFDEIEKAHHDVFNIFLQLLDEGRITDSHGRTVNFTNCFVIMTSNIGSHHILETLGNNEGSSKEAVYVMMKQKVVESARQTFRPEFMNRIDEYIVFQPLDLSEISKIVEFQMRRVKNRLKQIRINLEYTKKAVHLLAQLGFDPNNGARPVKRMIEDMVKKEIALKVLKRDFVEEDTIFIDVDQANNKLVTKKLENNVHVEEMVA
ncbi:unnamed protein product [Arabis nemorensis]|uniref:Clp ATPase C-terminal domain-containing protein n=1 Tax=Arabis nemorensis TaxID=586526 RepID=A0A565C5U9_9BRAS|nr:unnamed protein product [Arabis nemorensis]